MNQQKSAAAKRRRTAVAKVKPGSQSTRVPSGATSSPKNGQNKAAAQKRAAREKLRAQLPPLDPHYQALWDRGAAKAYSERGAEPMRISVRMVHKKRLGDIAKRTGLDRQVILNRAIATAWEKLGMSGTDMEAAAAKLRRQRSGAGGTVSLYPTQDTLRILRQAQHPQAKAILLQTGLDIWR